MEDKNDRALWQPPPEDDAVSLQSNDTANYIFYGPNGLRAGWSILGFLLLFRALSFVLVPIAHTILRHTGVTRVGGEDALTVLLLDAFPFVAVLIAAAIMAWVEKRPLASYGLGAFRTRQFFTGAFWGLLQLSLLVLVLWHTHYLVFDGRQLFGMASLHYALLWGLAFLFVAFFEEYLLRGYLQFTLARGLQGAFRGSRTGGFWAAAIALSLLFALGHHANKGESPIGLAAAGLFGLVFCLSLWRTGSLWWAVGWHAAWDWAQSFLFGVADSGITTQHHLLATHPQGAMLMSGGLTGPEGSVFVIPIALLTVAIIFVTLRAEESSGDAA